MSAALTASHHERGPRGDESDHADDQRHNRQRVGAVVFVLLNLGRRSRVLAAVGRDQLQCRRRALWFRLALDGWVDPVDLLTAGLGLHGREGQLGDVGRHLTGGDPEQLELTRAIWVSPVAVHVTVSTTSVIDCPSPSSGCSMVRVVVAISQPDMDWTDTNASGWSCGSWTLNLTVPASSRSSGTLKPILANEPCVSGPNVSMVTWALACDDHIARTAAVTTTPPDNILVRRPIFLLLSLAMIDTR